MKNIFTSLLVLSFSVSALAAKVTLTSDATDPAKAKLSELPAKLLGLMVDQPLSLKKAGDHLYRVEVRNVHCDLRHNGALDNERGGIPTVSCRMGSESKMDTKKGRRLLEARELTNLLGQIDNANLGVYFTDCAMGYCGTWVKSISCTVDTSVEEFAKGRFSCTLEDGQ